LDRGKKEILVDDMRGRLAKARATFLVNYQGIDVATLNALRRDLRKVDTEFRVVKNRLLKLASRDTQTACIQEHFVGPCAVAVTHEDVVGPAKILVDRDRKLEHLKLKVGQIGGKVIGVEEIKRLAELPSREVLLSLVLGAMQGVPTSLVRVLNGVVLKLLYALKSIEAQKGDSGNP
jgi:large subunit ribosomal protein L10